MKQKLLEEGERRREKESREEETSSSSKAFALKEQNKTAKRNYNNKGNCGTGDANEKTKFIGKCYNCGIAGHSAKYCRRKKEETKKTGKQLHQLLSITGTQ